MAYVSTFLIKKLLMKASQKILMQQRILINILRFSGFTCLFQCVFLIICNLSSFSVRNGESMFCAAFLNKKLICQILTSKLAPSLVYHGLIRALLSLTLIDNKPACTGNIEEYLDEVVHNINSKIKNNVHNYAHIELLKIKKYTMKSMNDMCNYHPKK